jgi:hypothetical protein
MTLRLVRISGLKVLNSRTESPSQARQPGACMSGAQEVINIRRNEGPEISDIFDTIEVKEAGAFVLKVTVHVCMPKLLN